MSYLARLLAGYRQGLAHDLLEPAEAIQAALTEEGDPGRRGVLLGLLAQSLIQQDQYTPKIDELEPAQRFATEDSPECTDRPVRLRRGRRAA
jgi:hypothetical protein